MNTMSAVEAREHFSEVLNRTAYGKERTILTRHGRKLAVVMPLEDLETLEALEDKIDVEEAIKAMEEPGETSLEALKKELGF